MTLSAGLDCNVHCIKSTWRAKKGSLMGSTMMMIIRNRNDGGIFSFSVHLLGSRRSLDLLHRYRTAGKLPKVSVFLPRSVSPTRKCTTTAHESVVMICCKRTSRSRESLGQGTSGHRASESIQAVTGSIGVLSDRHCSWRLKNWGKIYQQYNVCLKTRWRTREEEAKRL